MYLKTKSGRKVYLPTPEEDTAITATAMSDPNALPLIGDEFARVKRVGRPRAAVTKKHISIRLSRDVLDSFRSMGNGWQTKIDEALMEWIREHHS
jgi:uncharacterized protein (DUF4415 family)